MTSFCFIYFQTNVDVNLHKSVFYRIDPSNQDPQKWTQPYILFSSDDRVTGDFYLKANDLTLHLGSSPLQAFCILMKYHHVFDVSYDCELQHFYVFFEYLYGLPGVKLTAKMLEFLTKLRNLYPQ